jgi:DNA polymerase (family 10)
MDNREIAQRLRQYAHQLDGQDGNLFRIRAYRRAAQIILGLDRPLCEILAESGGDGLEALPGIGDHLAFTIEHLARTGEFLTFEEREAADWRKRRRKGAAPPGEVAPPPRAAG